MAVLFIIVAGISAIRHYADVVTVTEETCLKNSLENTSRSNMATQHSLIQRANYEKSIRLPFQIFFASCGIIGLIVISAGSFEAPPLKPLTLVDGFIWNPTDEGGTYTSCELPTKHRFGKNSTLADFVLLSLLPYQTDAAVTLQVEDWFQDTEVTEDALTIQHFRHAHGFDKSPVYFRLFRFPLENGNDDGVITIRGTNNNWDIVSVMSSMI
jgi:hypothetical protein